MQSVGRDTPNVSFSPSSVSGMGYSQARQAELEDDVDDVAQVSPWMRPLSRDARVAAQRIAAEAPPLSDRQRERLRLLFRAQSTD
jgi:hypothetical protein